MDMQDEPAVLDVKSARPTNFRWVICGLLFAATTMNYLNRGVLSLLASDLQTRIGWNDRQYGNINAAFTVGYAVGFILMGRLVERIGTKYGYAAALTLWSLASAATGFARSAFGFGVSRMFLGIFEAGNFPAAARTTAEWFPQRQRAAATGIFNAGSNIGTIAAAAMVPVLAIRFGWQSAFVVTGLAGLAWVIVWLPLYSTPETSPFANDAERTLIRSDTSAETSVEPMRWREILPYSQCWCVMAGKFLTDPIWWFYLFWSGKFLADRYGVDLKHLGPQLMVVYLMADVGSIAGGYISSFLLGRGLTANAARKTALIICGSCALPVSLITFVPNVWVAVGLLGLAAAAHQGFSANLLTLPSDLFPRRAVASVSGLAGLAGATGGFLMQELTGHATSATHSYKIPFMVSSVAYLVAVGVMHLLSPRLERIPTITDRGFDVVRS